MVACSLYLEDYLSIICIFQQKNYLLLPHFSCPTFTEYFSIYLYTFYPFFSSRPLVWRWPPGDLEFLPWTHRKLGREQIPVGPTSLNRLIGERTPPTCGRPPAKWYSALLKATIIYLIKFVLLILLTVNENCGIR